MNNTICPKCSSNMVQHPSLLSMPFGSSQKMMTTTTTEDNATMKVNIEDHDANFNFPFLFLQQMWIYRVLPCR